MSSFKVTKPHNKQSWREFTEPVGCSQVEAVTVAFLLVLRCELSEQRETLWLWLDDVLCEFVKAQFYVNSQATGR